MTIKNYERYIYNKLKNDRVALKILIRIYNLFGRNNYNNNGNRNKIQNDMSLLQKVKFDIQGDNNKIIFFGMSHIENVTFFIRGTNHVLTMGENCFIKGGSFWFEDNNCSISIGERTSIENAHIAVTENGKIIEIGKDCMLAYDIEIRTGDSHSIIDINTNNRINPAKDVKIFDHVWIGADVKILKGVTIGKNSIIGTGSIVTKSIPDYCLAAGIPAKIIRNNVTWKRPRI